MVLTHPVCCVTGEKLQVYGTQIFYNGQDACLTLALGGNIIFIVLDRKQTCFLLQRDILFMFQGCLLYKHP